MTTSLILAPLPRINLLASPFDFKNLRIFKASIKLISLWVIFKLGKVSSVSKLLNNFADDEEILSATSELLHNFVTSFARIILASLISAPLNFSNFFISEMGSSVNNFKYLIDELSI